MHSNCKPLGIRKGVKFLSCLFMVSILILSSCANIFAAEPYSGYNYTYNYMGRVGSPNGYLPVKSITGHDLGISHFSKPADVFVDSNDNIYLLDSGNGRVVIMDKEFNLIKTVDNFTKEENGIVTPSPLKNPGGIYVTKDGEMYIADKENHRIVVANQEGQIRIEYFKPNSDLLNQEIDFNPHKIVVNATGDMYVLAENVNNGALIITEEGEFTGFFGAEKIQLDAEGIADLFWRSILTDEQIAQMTGFVPVEYSNMFMDGDFVYTATAYEGVSNQIKKVNPTGSNIFSETYYFGDWVDNNQTASDGEELWKSNSFVDVCADEDGFFYCLDKSSGRVYMYNQELDLLLIFGGIGVNIGEFKNPVSIEKVGDQVIVLDDSKMSLTVFEPTVFGNTVREAVSLYEHGKYQEALEPWNEVKKMNSNYELAYVGIGRALMMTEDYQGAKENFKLGYDKDGYSEAKKEIRSKFLREHFSMMLTVLVIIIIFIWYLNKKKTKIRKALHIKTVKETGYAGMAKWKYPFYIMRHPSDGLQEMKNNKKGSIGIAVVVLAVWYLSAVIIRQFEDFVYNPTNPDKLNIFLIAAGTIGILLIACIANWAVSTLMDGKGTLKDIIIAASYAMIPSIISTLIVTIMSQFMISEEAVFVHVIIFIGTAWSALLVLISAQVIHDFSFKKAIIMLLLTALGMIIMLFLLLLLYTLYNQVVQFVGNIYYEIIYRFFAIK